MNEEIVSKFRAICETDTGGTLEQHTECETDLDNANRLVNHYTKKKGGCWISEEGVLNLVKDIGLKDSDSSLTNEIKKAFQMLAAARLAVAKLVLICQEMRDIDMERVQGV